MAWMQHISRSCKDDPQGQARTAALLALAFEPMHIPRSISSCLFFTLLAVLTACSAKSVTPAQPEAQVPAKNAAAQAAKTPVVEPEEIPAAPVKPAMSDDGLVAVSRNSDGTPGTIASKGALPKSGAGPNPAVLNATLILMAKPEQPDAAIEVQHCLVAFMGSGVAKATRSKEDAETLAHALYLQAYGGSDFDALVKLNTDDSSPGIYPMTVTSRKGMVSAFGDVGWRLKVGEIGLAVYDPKTSPFGWHIIKRTK